MCFSEYKKILSVLLAFVSVAAAGQVYAPEFVSSDAEFEEIRDRADTPERILWQEVDADFPDGYVDPSVNHYYGGLEYRYLDRRRALTGRYCTVNKLINAAGVGSWNKDMGALTNEDLSDYAQFNYIANVGITVNPFVSIRDTHNYYAKGTEAGYCLVAGSGSAVLQLDVVKAMSIGFYRDGKLLGTKAVQEGQDGSGVTLSLIQIPGSSDATVMLTAKSDWVFDEISLNPAGGVNVGVATLYKIKYAFVGRAHRFTMTTHTGCGGDCECQTVSELSDYYHRVHGTDDDIEIDYVKGWNPVLLGIPFPWASGDRTKFSNCPCVDDKGVLSPIVAVGYQGGAKFMLRHRNNLNQEVFKAGTEVGFKYEANGALSLAAGTWIRMILFDRNGNKVQEETISAEVLNLSLVQVGNGTSTITSKVPFSGAELRFHTVLGVDLGGIGIYYAYTNEPPAAEHFCDISPTVDTHVCPDQSSIQLYANPDIPVTWSVSPLSPHSPSLSPDLAISSSGYVTGMVAGEKYVFRAEAADGCYEDTEVDLSPFGQNVSKCEIPAAGYLQYSEGDSEYQPGYYTTDAYGNKVWYQPDNYILTAGGERQPAFDVASGNNSSHGGLLTVFDKCYNENNVVDADLSNYAEYGGLELAANQPIIGVRKVCGTDADGNPHWPGGTDYIYNGALDTLQAGMRMGFVVEMATSVLNLNLLSFYNIRCYYKGKETYRHVVTESNGVDLDLIGGSDVQRTKYSIKVPRYDDDGNYVVVDQIELWVSGVLDLKGSKLKIYYAFTDEVGYDCDDPLQGCGSQLLSTKTTNTTINADATTYGSAVQVANVTNNLSFLVDDDPETACTYMNTVAVGAGVTIAVKMGRTLDFHHQIGIVTSAKTYLANVGVGTWLTVKTYYNGVETGDVKKDWSVVGADVAGAGDKNCLFMQPTKRYDELRIEIGGVINALEPQQFYGIVIRGDVNNDGVLDCVDSNSCETDVTSVAFSPVCLGHSLDISAKGSIDTDYYVVFTDDATAEMRKITSSSTGEIAYTYTPTRAGMYQMMFYNGSKKLIHTTDYQVHPAQTAWRTNTANGDWTNWGNWTNGTPYCCTDIIIPTGAEHYPVLSVDAGKQMDTYCAQGVHFEPGAEIGGVQRLNYHSAWAEVEMRPNRYYNLSAPLREMYTGDMFVGALTGPLPADGVVSDGLDYFTVIDGGNLAPNRFNPSIYQRFYANTSNNYTLAGTQVAAEMWGNNWSHYFNSVRTPYEAGRGFSVWVDEGNLTGATAFRFRFPKWHSEYRYFTDYGPVDAGVGETIGTRAAADRFAYEAITSENTHDTTFVYPYPAMSASAHDEYRHLYDQPSYTISLTNASAGDMYHFGNPFMSRIDIKQFLQDNQSVVSEVYFTEPSSTSVARLKDGKLVGTAESGTIAPWQSVFLKARVTGTSLNVLVDANAISTEGDKPLDGPDEPSLIVRATAGDHRSTLLLAMSERMSPATALIDTEVLPEVSLFAATAGEARAIDMFSGETVLGICTARETDITLSFTAREGFPRNDYRLVDIVSGQQWELYDDITLAAQTTTVGRYVIRRATADSVEDSVCQPGIVVTVDGQRARVTSQSSPIASVRVCDLSGREQFSSDDITTEMTSTIPLSAGIQIISVRLESGHCQSFKLVVK